MTKENRFGKLVEEIENTRVELHNLIEEKEFSLLDFEVIKLSKKLDKLLCKYYTINQ